MPARHREVAYAKLTRTLRVEGLRKDGYHLLRSEMVSIDLADELEIDDGDGLEVRDEVAWTPRDARRERASIPGGDDNLVRRALALCGRKAFVRLTKRIPHGAGLGGGSADAAAVLRWAGCAEPSLAVRLGADVPFCLSGGRALVTGIGEVVEPLGDEALSFVLVTPEVVLDTTSVYAAFDELGVGDRSVAHNDLERAAIAVAPGLARVRDLLGEVSGRRAQLAGSGSTFFVECAPDELDGLVLEVRSAAQKVRGGTSVAGVRAMGATKQG